MKKTDKTFEQAIVRIEEIVSKLEQGDVPLQDALSWFEEGTALAAHCGGLLENAEQKVTKLTKTSNNTVEALPFDTDSASEAE